MNYQYAPVTSIEHEISHTKREIDNIEWEGATVSIYTSTLQT
jgi:hypothetical protein